MERWVENPYWQYFCGFEFFQVKPPIDPRSMTRWRSRVGPEGIEKLLSATVDVAVEAKVVKKSSFERVTVDTTVQPKNITHPMDSKLCLKALTALSTSRFGGKNRKILANSMSELFHPVVLSEFIARVWAVMEETPSHSYQILSKRPDRMAVLASSGKLVIVGWVSFKPVTWASFQSVLPPAGGSPRLSLHIPNFRPLSRSGQHNIFNRP